VLRYVTTQDGAHHVICQGQERFRVKEYLEGYPFLVARVERFVDGTQASQDIEARFLQLKKRAGEALELLPQTPQELAAALDNFTSPGALADMVAGFMDIKAAEKQAILETLNVQTRLDRVLELIGQRIEVLKLSKELEERTKESVDKRQREFLLREQLKTIQKELGEGEDGGVDGEDLEKAVTEAKQVHPCGTGDKTHAYDLHDEDGDDALVPCSKAGGKDFSGGVHIETIQNPVRYTYAQIEQACKVAAALGRGKLILAEPPRR